MADYLFPSTGQRSEYTPGTAEKLRALDRRQKIAAALIEQGMQPKQVRQAGRFVVAPSMWEQLSGPLTTGIGALTSAYLDREREGVQASETAKVAEAMQQYAKGQEDVPEYRGRTVPGTGSPAVAAQPSNLEDIIRGGQPDTDPTQLRKPSAQVADALFARQQPQQLQVPPEFAAYRPGVQGAAAVPDRRETVDEALNRVGGEGTAQGVNEGWIDPGPIVRPDLAAAVSEARRPDQAARPRTPAELRAADMALLASGAPAAWPLVHLTMQQREADRARAETIADRAETRRTTQEDRAEARRITHLDNQEKRALLREDLEAKRDDRSATREQRRSYNAQILGLRQQALEQASEFHKDRMAALKDNAAAPAALKAQGAETLHELTESLRGMYTELAASGGITDASKSTVDNIIPYLASTMAGQVAGKMVGSANQSIRNQIEATKPLLLQSIAQATGIKASQLNSDRELQQYLLAATSTSNDIASNLAALTNLTRLYGGGDRSIVPSAGQAAPVSALDKAMGIHGGRK